MRRAYLDHNATTPLRPEAKAAMAAAFEVAGNPSSQHAEGRAARALVDEARHALAAMVGCRDEDVVFTSCGTEALNLVLTRRLAFGDGQGCEHLLVGAGEHPAVMAGHRFADRVTGVALTPDGVLDLDVLRETLTWVGGKRVMLALQAANNETGVLQPVREAAALVHEHGGYVVCDAVQAAGKIACDIDDLGVDALVVSAHKFGGPKGIGALCFAASRHHLSKGVVRGGGQERGLRGGTENVIGIAGLGAVCSPAEAQRAALARRWAGWRDGMAEAVRGVAPDLVVFGDRAKRLANTLSFAVPGLDARTLLMRLDLDGVAVSAGSACAAGKVAKSHVLAAMGVEPDLAASAVRVSLGWSSADEDVAQFNRAIAKAIVAIRPRIAA